MYPSVSIAFPCWSRGPLLEKTLESIVVQKYPGPLELVVVETGDDGITKQVADRYGAKYVQYPRLQEWPIFQSITEMWNLCWHNCSNEIVMLQCPEVLHESAHVIEDLVARVQSGTKILATPLIRELALDGSFMSWYNHPREGTRPNWISGAGPHTFRNKEMQNIGGYEEAFYGYGHEDDYFFYCLRKNGWSIEYVESAVCGHQNHPRYPYEPVTGYANRALMCLLTHEVADGVRKPITNFEPVKIDTSVTEEDVSRVTNDALNMFPMSDTFKEWAHNWLYRINRHPSDVFNWQRTIANEKLGRVSEIGEMITEAAWGVLIARDSYNLSGEQKSHAASSGSESTRLWSERAYQRAQITHTWASYALAKAKRLMS